MRPLNVDSEFIVKVSYTHNKLWKSYIDPNVRTCEQNLNLPCKIEISIFKFELTKRVSHCIGHEYLIII